MSKEISRVQQALACLVLSVGLHNFAVAEDDSSVRVVTNRIQSGMLGFTEAAIPGPVILVVPGFAEIFVASCRDSVIPPEIGIRNTTSEGIDVFGAGFTVPPFAVWDEDGILQPGETAQFFGGSSASGQSIVTVQLGAGSGKSRRVATVVASGASADVAGHCRFQGQAVIHRF